MSLRSIFDKCVSEVDNATVATINDLKKVIEWVSKTEPTLAAALADGYAITSKFVAWAKSPGGIAVEALIASVVPQEQAWTSEVIILATTMGTAMQKVAADLPSVEGIALQYLRLIASKIEGGKTALDNVILEAQKIFVTAS